MGCSYAISLQGRRKSLRKSSIRVYIGTLWYSDGICKINQEMIKQHFYNVKRIEIFSSTSMLKSFS